MSLRLHLSDLHYDLTDLQEQQEAAHHDEHILLEVIRNVDGLPEAAIVKQHIMASKLVRSTSYRLEQVHSHAYTTFIDSEPTNTV